MVQNLSSTGPPVPQVRADRHDLLIVTDATGSMGTYLTALNDSLPEIIAISALTDVFDRIGVLAFRDYSDDQLLEWLGWYNVKEGPISGTSPNDKTVTQDELITAAKSLEATGGGDFPEAGRTALAKAYYVMRSDAHTIILLYADAPPHLKPYPAYMENPRNEDRALGADDAYGGHGKLFLDWATGCHTLADGGPAGKTATVFSYVLGTKEFYSAWMYLSQATRGVSFFVTCLESAYISELTIGTLLAWMGVSKETASADAAGPQVTVLRYKAKIPRTSVTRWLKDADSPHNAAVKHTSLSFAKLSTRMPTRLTEVMDFAKRYQADAAYRDLVQRQLSSIITTNVQALTANPVFGTLWRVVSADRTSTARDDLVAQFGTAVNKITDPDVRARLTKWLAESYDFAAEIRDYIEEVPDDLAFPCVFLDPTQDFSVNSTGDDDDRPLNEFTRDELLEISRSCNGNILRRLGMVLTRLSYVERAEDLSAHIQKAGSDVPRLPLALASTEYKRRFWRCLLHLVLPGTLLPMRGAALVAALALRIGLRPLQDIADRELLLHRDTWNNIDIYETWSAGCLRLLLDADADYEGRVAAGETARATREDANTILRLEDKRLFSRLLEYANLERNLSSTLTARLGWTPDKTPAPIGPLATCRLCLQLRSVTIMGAQKTCGPCLCRNSGCKCSACSAGPDEWKAMFTPPTDFAPTSSATWVECSVRSCRAQYVVMNPNLLNIKPKCHRCREHDQGPPTWLECSQCRNRIIYPPEYRPPGLKADKYKCHGCTGQLATIVDAETTAEELRLENGTDWIIQHGGVLPADMLFNGRSLYKTASNVDRAVFADKVVIVPPYSGPMFLRGKHIHNVDTLQAKLRQWVASGRAEQGTCSMCFSDKRKNALVRACGRAGCTQLVCDPCRRRWYGLNQRGRVINIAALHCAFCRRLPAASTVRPFGLTGLGDLAIAVAESGAWIHAWCAACGFARRYVPRECARGAPLVEDWQCQPCVEAHEAARLAEIEAAEAALRAVQNAQNAEARAEIERLRAERDRATYGPGVRQCPGCKTRTVKAYGCDHMTCPCGTHWCFACGDQLESTPIEIYHHMREEHAGLYGDDDLPVMIRG